jgi:ubiquitin-conjugating enzyme E2 M
VCLNILKLDWSPVLSLSSIIFGLLLLFDEPNPEDPLNKGISLRVGNDCVHSAVIDAAELLRRSPQLFLFQVQASMRGEILDGISFSSVFDR